MDDLTVKITEATDGQIEHMKRFWNETPDQPAQRLLTASILKEDFLSLVARLEKLQDALATRDARIAKLTERNEGLERLFDF